MKNKICTKCKMLKPVSEFYKDKYSNDGYYSWCKKCKRASTVAWGKANRDKKNKGQRAWNKRNRVYARAGNLKRKFGITLADYDKMWNEQGGLCAACNMPETAMREGIVKYLAIDHCHKTGEVRALLCQRCNCVLGHVGDNIGQLTRLIEYLVRYS